MPLFPQRNPSTGSRLYTNADLVRRRASAEEDAMPADGGMLATNVPQRQEGDIPIELLLAEARGTLDQGDHLAEEFDDPDASIEDTGEYARYNAEAPSVTDSTMGRVKKSVLHYLKTRPEVISKAAAVDAFIPGPLGVPGRLVQGAESLDDLGDLTPSNIAEHPMQAAGTGLGLLQGVLGLGSVSKGVKMAQRFNRMKPAVRAAATSAKQAATVRGTVETAEEALKGGASRAQASQRAGWPLGKSKQTGIINHSQADTASPISEIMEGNGGAFNRPRPAAPSPMDALRTLSSEQNLRTNPQTGEIFAGDSPNRYAPFTNNSLSALGAGPSNTYATSARQEIAALRNLIRQQVR